MTSDRLMDEPFAITPDTNHWVDMFVFTDGTIQVSLKRGQDVTVALEELLREYGVDCQQIFKSPCG